MQSFSKRRLLITGSSGMLGSHILDFASKNMNYQIVSPSRSELNLYNAEQTFNFLKSNKITSIIHCAAQVGGIRKNIEDPSGFLSKNLLIDTSIIWAAERLGIDELLYFGSSCMYPRVSEQPMITDQILTGALEPTNEGYALAKIAGSKLVTSLAKQNNLRWRVLILSNLYGPRDNFEETSSHLLAAIIRKISEAKVKNLNEVIIWGDGQSRREFTYVEDVARYVIQEYANMKNWPYMMNLGCGIDYSVLQFYEMVAEKIGYKGLFRFDNSKPNGMPRKLLDSSVATEHNWRPKTPITEGIEATFNWYLNQREEV